LPVKILTSRFNGCEVVVRDILK